MRAQALGATAWALDARGAIEAAARLPVVVSPAAPLPEAAAKEQAALEWDHLRLVDQVRRQWSVTTPAEADAAQAAVRAVARDGLPQTLHAVSAALLTGDPRTVSVTAAWLAALLVSRGVDPRLAISQLAQVLTSALLDYPLSVRLIRSHFLVN